MRHLLKYLAPHGAPHQQAAPPLAAILQMRTPGFTFALILAFSLATGIPPALAQSSDESAGVAELKKGDYENAIKLLTGRLAANSGDGEAEADLMRAYLETGRYAEAEANAKKFLVKNTAASRVHHQLGEVFALTGRYSQAIGEFEWAATGAKSAADKLSSDLRRAEMLELTGQEERAKPIFESLVVYYKEKQPAGAAELTLVARALVHLERFHDANDIYRDAIAADPTYIEAQLGAGELFNQKYQYGDAAQFFQDALQINPNSARALIGIAENKRIEGGEQTLAALTRALAINPVGVLTFKAGLELEEHDLAAAEKDIERALKINPQSLDAHAVKAAMLYLQDRDFQPEVNAALAINPHYGLIFNVLSHYATLTRRTEDAVGFARRATELSPRLWSAHLDLGMALLRLGQMEEGRAEIEKSFQGDPYNVWAKNTLDLLDAMKDYRETKHGPFLIKVDAKESDVVAPYASDLLNEAARQLTAKYRFTPKGPITVELFPNHEDFAVRTLGLPGLGALGVCFGQVIAADSPSARPTGEFNWGSTLWHEYTHVITLQMTEYRIPRWFSEGLSVYEERRARPGWGDDWNPMLLNSFTTGRWHKIADLDGAFSHPHGPEDLTVAYFQASQVCEFVSERYGFDAILRMLALYRDKAQTADVLMRALKLSESDFDRAFNEYVAGKARPMEAALKTEFNVAASMTKEDVLNQLATQDTFALHLRAGHLFHADHDDDNAIRHFRRAIELFPYYTGDGNPYDALVEIYQKKGDLEQASAAMSMHVRYDQNDLAAIKELAGTLTRLGNSVGAFDALQRGFYISPFEYSAHSEAGQLCLGAKKYDQALAEFKVALALDPPNVAEANYNLASAYHLLGKQPEAKHAVLRALEAAPSYEKAQELLLKIVGQ
ncbi:MAG TPA: tetratricopeptide repeat protein [Pyrinomonadaceae bacterium]|nr:tetratricopeptide repeat protein [Pyrinomonadaceae bacterium]